MSRKFLVWLANHQSNREQEVTLDDIGVTSEEWDEMTYDQQGEYMKDIAWNCMDWGFQEIK